jgi:hypothetical protein
VAGHHINSLEVLLDHGRAYWVTCDVAHISHRIDLLNIDIVKFL